jgi:hypothetical protein
VADRSGECVAHPHRVRPGRVVAFEERGNAGMRLQHFAQPVGKCGELAAPWRLRVDVGVDVAQGKFEHDVDQRVAVADVVVER